MMRRPRQVIIAAKKPTTTHSGICASAGSAAEASSADAAPNAQTTVSTRHGRRSMNVAATRVPAR